MRCQQCENEASAFGGMCPEHLRCRRCGDRFEWDGGFLKDAAEVSSDGLIHAECMVEGEEVA